MRKNNFICPLCGSHDYTIELDKRLQDPVSKKYELRPSIKICKDCSLVAYPHPFRGWEGGFFDDTTNASTYFLTHAEFTQGIRDTIEMQKLLPARTLAMTDTNLNDSTRESFTPLAIRSKNKIADIYYYKSSPKGIEVLP